METIRMSEISGAVAAIVSGEARKGFTGPSELGLRVAEQFNEFIESGKNYIDWSIDHATKAEPWKGGK